jgi:hypothetical protein
MDVSCTTITLHPKARDFLFEHFVMLKVLFNDVLGHLEIDYMSIALLNSQNELLFLSSKPSIECNLIENNLWAFDPSLQYEFFMQDQPKLWDEVYQAERHKLVRQYKQESQGFSMGISIPSVFDEYRVVYSFALKSKNESIKNNITNKIQTLLSMGRFCLRNIIQTIALPIREVKKASLTLVINNKGNHETIT